ncbi:response regulator transcription factor [Aquabacterium sp.]|uniref:response regulator transcription factor n=1 Tax=Aquabacterium sp. TaxID=1872578 RepID=UPI0037832750
MIRDNSVLDPWRGAATRQPSASNPPTTGSEWPGQTPSLVLFVGAGVRPEPALSDTLAQAGLRCAAASSVATALQACANLQFDALVLDAAVLAPSLALALAGLQPLAGCPLLVVSAQPSEVDEIVALEHGAAAYLPQPFSPRRLRAHLVALLRQRPGVDADDDSVSDPKRRGQWLLDPMLRELRWSGQSVALTECQFAILRCLATQAGRVVPRAELEARVTGPDSTLTARSIDVYLHRLRRRLDEAGVDAFEIQCVRGRGYRLLERRREAALSLS